MARDAGIKRDCPFCGEGEHLSLQCDTIERAIVVGNDTLKDTEGQEIPEYVDGVSCDVCLAMAPLDVWNREVPAEVFAVLRDFDPPDEVAEAA